MSRYFFLAFLIIFKVAILGQTRTYIFGHRGCRGLMPENTIEAFNKAIDLGTDGVEWDVVVNKDKQLVVSHEPYIDSKYCLTPEGENISNEKSLNIYEMSQDEIEKYDCGSKPYDKYPEQKKIKTHKPLLQEVFKNVDLSKQIILFEIKSEAKDDNKYQPEPKEYASIIIKEVENFPFKKNIIFMSFDKRMLNELYKNDSSLKMVYLTYSPFKSVKNSLKDLDFKPYAMGMFHPTIGKKDIEFAHNNNIKVFAWTVNKTEEAEKLKKLSIDGLITDYPDRIKN